MAQPSKSISLDTGEYFQIPTSTGINSVMTGSFTIGAWAQFRADPNSNDTAIWDYWETGKKNSQFVFAGATVGDKLYISTSTDGSATSATNNGTTIPALDIDTWYYLVVTYDISTGTAKFYYKPESGSLTDYELTGLSTTLFDMSGASDPKPALELFYWSSGDSFKLVHDLRIYDAALSEAQIDAASDVDISDSATNLVCRLKFADNLNDATSNSHDAEMGNGTASYVETIPTWAGGGSSPNYASTPLIIM